MKFNNKKCLIAYYSRKGENYVSGSIIDLKVGNTEVVTNMIKDLTGGDLFNIDTIKSYPVDYSETTEVARKELRYNARPELTNHIENMADYDVVFLGYPNWWGTFPMSVFTFLEEYDFSEKTIIPFCTHEGSGLGNSERDIKKLCPQSNISDGLAIHGTKVSSSKESVINWLDKI